MASQSVTVSALGSAMPLKLVSALLSASASELALASAQVFLWALG